ncbi:hydantoinase/oxoprolinase family protein [Roseicitreum antarcticum]|uniref:N-methylhydantoinase A n=1 Tax=Roseicitreum antarcticum TaxID=564137 RepID=A0A1H3AUU3_9RHOB|nr:hydantoinase/oxoprolinase family protein [Roseicitreum antarcticum]SDX33141.1 N-methylhydantoinase A [Roseicitreum antarcticum]
MRLRLGLDVGGTFTDIVATDLDTGAAWSRKIASTPDDPSRAILDGTAELLAEAGASGADVVFFGHGTTVVTNMIVERKGDRLALITTKGFRDILELGRQSRPSVYNYRITRPAPLAQRRDRFEVTERLRASGEVLIPLDMQHLDEIAETIRTRDIGAVAICYLHAYANPKHEDATLAYLRAALPGVFITTSHAVAPEYREFERFSTTAMNGYVGPRAKRYFRRLADGLTSMGLNSPLYTITSNAGLMDLTAVEALPVRTALSGPAAGVAGIGRMLAGLDLGDLVTFDVGGTSTDVAVISGGRPRLARVRSVAGHPVLAPMVDIEVVGAGGGSLARLDDGGALVVGPQSAGADPGPVAYRRGGTCPTVTDAALAMGWLDPEIRLGGRLTVDTAAASDAIRDQIAQPLGLSVGEAAEGIVAIATANMARVIRSVALTRGYEPGAMSLVAFGGAGPLMGAQVAAGLGMSRVIVPVQPGTLCARGLLVSDVARDLSLTRIIPLTAETAQAIDTAFEDMEKDGGAWLGSLGVPVADHRFARQIEARYSGQSFEITVEANPSDTPAALRARFEEAHRIEQGYDLPDRAVEVVTLRLKAATTPIRAHGGSGAPVVTDDVGHTRDIHIGGAWQTASIRQREQLPPGTIIAGPAILEEMTATTVIPPGWSAEVLKDGTLILTPELQP